MGVARREQLPHYGVVMQVLSERDTSVVWLVDRLGQAASTHILHILFNPVSPKPMYRSLERLTKQKYLVRIGRRATNDIKGGAGPAVYQLGSVGFWFLKKGEFKRKEVDPHTLLAADVVLALTLAEREGKLKAHALYPEYRFRTVRADLYLDVTANGMRIQYALEVQRTVNSTVIRRKLQPYWDAYEADTKATAAEVVDWPYVVFLAANEYKADQMRKYMPREWRELFKVWLASEVVERVERQ